jgi:hypothetical protein
MQLLARKKLCAISSINASISADGTPGFIFSKISSFIFDNFPSDGEHGLFQ